MISEKQIIEEYKRGQRSFDNIELDDHVYDFRNAILAGINFSSSFIEADFSGADLQGADFSNSNVKACSFSGADLRGANFTKAALDDADFSGAKLGGANFDRATFYAKIFTKNEKPSI